MAVRAGAHALAFLAAPLNLQLLLALRNGPRALVDLRREVGLPPETTVRMHMRALQEEGIIERSPSVGGARRYELGEAGRALLEVSDALRRWFKQAPELTLELGTPAAKGAIKALVDGWSSAVIRAIAARPLAHTELSKLIPNETYPSLGRRLSAMRSVGLLEPRPSNDRSTPYGATPWLRQAVAPLAAAARWESIYSRENATPIGRLDVEAALLLVLPMLELPAASSGTCRIVVELRGGGSKDRLAGAQIDIRGGRLATCSARPRGVADSWASGPPQAWLEAVVTRDAGGLEIGGDAELAYTIVDCLHGLLVSARPVPRA